MFEFIKKLQSGGNTVEPKATTDVVVSNPVVDAYSLINKDNSDYNSFTETLPRNLQPKVGDDYDMRYLWDNAGKPKDFDEALNNGLFALYGEDQKYHAFSSEPHTGRHLKSRSHPTLYMEAEYFHKGKNGNITVDDKNPNYLKYVSGDVSDIEESDPHFQEFINKGRKISIRTPINLLFSAFMSPGTHPREVPQLTADEYLDVARAKQSNVAIVNAYGYTPDVDVVSDNSHLFRPIFNRGEHHDYSNDESPEDIKKKQEYLYNIGAYGAFNDKADLFTLKDKRDDNLVYNSTYRFLNNPYDNTYSDIDFGQDVNVEKLNKQQIFNINKQLYPGVNPKTIDLEVVTDKTRAYVNDLNSRTRAKYVTGNFVNADKVAENNYFFSDKVLDDNFYYGNKNVHKVYDPSFKRGYDNAHYLKNIKVDTSERLSVEALKSMSDKQVFDVYSKQYSEQIGSQFNFTRPEMEDLAKSVMSTLNAETDLSSKSLKEKRDSASDILGSLFKEISSGYGQFKKDNFAYKKLLRDGAINENVFSIENEGANQSTAVITSIIASNYQYLKNRLKDTDVTNKDLWDLAVLSYPIADIKSVVNTYNKYGNIPDVVNAFESQGTFDLGRLIKRFDRK